jgi:hypothetical protein
MGEERILISIAGDAGEDYDSLLTKALAKAKEFLPHAAVHRAESDVDASYGAGEQWYIEAARSEVSRGGQTLRGDFVLQRHAP